MNTMLRVKKRNGELEQVSFDKVTNRLKLLTEMEPPLTHVNYFEIAQKVVTRIYDMVATHELDDLAAEQCTQKGVEHLEYNTLASRIAISNNHKRTSPSFSETMTTLYNNNDQLGKHCPLIAKDVYEFVQTNKNKLNDTIDYNKDFNFDYFALKTLEKAYLIKVNGQIVERIQDMIMRVSIGLHVDNLKDALETYELISDKYFTHATPTLFHSGTPRPQLLSCFLLGVGDSVEGMYKAMADCAQISKWAGGIGLHLHDIRGENALIRSTNGKSNGLVPLLRVFNDVARHINQSGKRNGSFAMYLEPWHPDIFGFLEAKKNHGDENSRARDLFYAVWLSDLFMERVKNNGDWSLLCPDTCKGLTDCYGEDFNKLYLEFESKPEYVKKVVKAQDIWKEILSSQMETGTPYICYKDPCNKKSNQKNLGTIKSSNLCTEIIEYSDTNEYACCTLASLSLSSFVKLYDSSKLKNIVIYSKSSCKFCDYSKKLLNSYGLEYKEINLDDDEERAKFFEKTNKNRDENDKLNTVPQIYISDEHIGGFDELYKHFKPTFDFKALMEVTDRITKNLDKVVDINFYPVIETKRSNVKHRPLGIGVQGLADVYAKFKYAFDSPEAAQLNKEIFAAIYYASCNTSMEIAKSREASFAELKKHLRGKEVAEFYDPEFKGRGEKLYHELKPCSYECNKSNYLGTYSSFEGSPMSEGKFQFDLWDKEPINSIGDIQFNWDELRKNILKHGIRNSLLLAPMPTASTSQILGNNECIEPFTSNIYSRGTLAGQFIVVNKYLQADLLRIGVWNNDIKDKIIINNGSIQSIEEIPDTIKEIYKTAWDLSMKSLIDQAADRGIYVCQSQSLNLWLQDPTLGKLSSMHMYAHSKGLKTGIYYLRRRAVANAQKFTIDPEIENACLSCSA